MMTTFNTNLQTITIKYRACYYTGTKQYGSWIRGDWRESKQQALDDIRTWRETHGFPYPMKLESFRETTWTVDCIQSIPAKVRTKKGQREMTQEEKSIKICEVLGWRECVKHDAVMEQINDYLYTPCPSGIDPEDGGRRMLPDYFNDLNACHEMEKTLGESDCWNYVKNLIESKDEIPDSHAADFRFHFSAEQRAEAFGKTLGLW